MNNRIWAVVAMFGGVAAMIGLWLLMTSTDAETQAAKDRAASRSGDPLKPTAVEVPPAAIAAAADLSVADIQARQRELNAVLQHGGGGPHAPVTPHGIYTLDQPGIEVAVDRHRSDIDGCWTAARAHQPDLASDTTLELSITPEANHPWSVVSGVKSGLGGVFDPCVAAVMQGTPFAGTEATTLRYPILFGKK